VGSNGTLECKPLSKTRTVQQPQPNAANPNAAESMVKSAHRTTMPAMAADGSTLQATRIVARGCWLLEREEYRTRIGMSVITLQAAWLLGGAGC
jgi:hypothetical protein